jgi:hypothetical protein
MLNQLHTAADLAADHRRTLRAEADAYRLARAAAPVSRPRRRWLRTLLAVHERHSRPIGSDAMHVSGTTVPLVQRDESTCGERACVSAR